MIVSDPTTSYILEPLTTINTPGGAYMNSKNRTSIAAIATATDSATLSKNLSSIRDPINRVPANGYLLVLSARYFQWAQQLSDKRLSFAFNIWRPQAMTLTDTIAVTAFEKNMDMKPVFTNISGAVFYIPRTSL
jgi:hypothetical protein